MKINVTSLRNSTNAPNADTVSIVWRAFLKRMRKRGFEDSLADYDRFVMDALKLTHDHPGTNRGAPLVSNCKKWIAIIEWKSAPDVEVNIKIYNLHT